MGAIADAIVGYAQPLIDMTDGSLEQLNKRWLLARPAGTWQSRLRTFANRLWRRSVPVRR
jgi:hypothetical protein